MNFSELKQSLLEKLDEEGWDKPVEPYLDMINTTDKCVTSSSCYGRIVLLNKPSESKKAASFEGKWHRKVNKEEVLNSPRKKEGTSWFKVDPLILHISCKDIETTKKVLKAKSKAGIKRGGVFHIAPERIQIEVIGTQKMELPIYKNDLLVSKKYVDTVIQEANNKFDRNKEQWERFRKAWKEVFE